MRRIARWACAAVAALAGVSSTAQVLTVPLAVNLPGGDPAVLRSLWWPIHAGGNFDISGEEFIVITYGSGACFDPLPPAPIDAVAEYANPRNGEFRLAVGAEAASLSADGWSPTGDSFHVLGDGTCYGGRAVFRFIRTRDGPRAGSLLTMDASNKALYDDLLSQGWTGRGIAFCAMA